MISFKPSDQRILFVGDSLTEYKGGWQHQLAKMRFEEYDNISKGGKRTKWMLDQLKKYPLNANRYNEVIIYGGINDSFSFVDEDVTVKNIQEMVYIAKKMGAHPIVIIGYNPEKVVKNTIYSKEVEIRCRDRYISLQKRLQTELKWCTIVPMENQINRSDSDDGLHLKASGHSKFSKWVYKNLEL
jgi:lysophospholipase L1-like esterase